ncbi:MAG: ATP-binding protein [Propionicimonas sp.]
MSALARFSSPAKVNPATSSRSSAAWLRVAPHAAGRSVADRTANRRTRTLWHPTRGLRRNRVEVEAAINFVCQEALQNAAKHGGPGANVTIEVQDHGAALRFSIDDHGVGSSHVGSGQGVANMHDRITEVGGEVVLDSAPGIGVTVHGQVPIR